MHSWNQPWNANENDTKSFKAVNIFSEIQIYSEQNDSFAFFAFNECDGLYENAFEIPRSYPIFCQ